MSMSLPERPVEIFKFGGTSVASPDRIRRVVELVQGASDAARCVVVVSALGGVTDDLIRAVDDALARTGRHPEMLNAVRRRHEDAVEALAVPEEQAILRSVLEACWQELGELLDGVYLLRECTRRTRDAIMGMGERASAPLVAAAFRAAGSEALALDARTLIRTDATFGEANVQFAETDRLIQERFSGIPDRTIAVVTGFIATTDRGVATTLGRSGSDYTATIVGRALDARQVVIWTDVDGVLSADPRVVREAFPLARLSYREAAEMAYFGAKVLHPRTMRPVEERGIPIRIKNTLNPEAPGTLISTETDQTDLRVKAITTIRDVAVVMLEGAGMLGVPGIAARVFGALAAQEINVLMIAQASSEQSICLVVRDADADAAVDALRSAFSSEIDRGDVSGVYPLPACAVVSAVGDRMRHQPGLAGRMFSTLGRSGVNVLAIAQGAAETNISAVVHDDEVPQALEALHEAFPLARRRAHVCVIGTGLVGKKLLDMMREQVPRLLGEMRLNLRLVGVANSRTMLWQTEGLSYDDLLARLAHTEQTTDLKSLVEQLINSRLERLIVVDTTASEAVARCYPQLLEHGIGVVTPNKRANTLDMAFYRRLCEAAKRREVSYRYEATVMAGLPVLSTLRDLLRSGDQVERIEGVFSGTLAYLFKRLADGCLFSEAVREAQEQGYTEPDPRDDLKGEDVARKLLILGREIGLAVEREEVEVESLVPGHLADTSVEAFMDGLEAMNAAWKECVEAAARDGKRLQYVGSIEDGRLRIGVRRIDADALFARLQGRDNAILFTTARYHDTPLVVQGPGAGPDVTAAGILADLLSAAELMP
ncbi:MAG: bifunctional aspartate kinase/homoserine dehydrogenase I [Rhodothermales bacterium]